FTKIETRAPVERLGLLAHLGRELAERRAEDPVEGGVGVDDVGQGADRRRRLEREHKLAEDLARAGRDKSGADQHAARAVGDELERAAVEIVDVAWAASPGSVVATATSTPWSRAACSEMPT